MAQRLECLTKKNIVVLPEQLTEKLLDWVHNHCFGKYRGIVTDNNDTTQRGRVKVRVPAVFGQDVDVWAMPCLPFTGDGMGLYTVPEPGAGVWVEFEGGDPSYPLWSGGWWADQQLPKNEKEIAATPSLKIIRSAKGLMLTMDDEGQAIKLSDQNGKNILTIDVQQGQITVKGKFKVVVEAPQIELVENAAQPLVFGNELMMYLNQLVTAFNTHLHAGELALGALPVTPAPPATPMSPPAPGLLSTKVKTG